MMSKIFSDRPFIPRIKLFHFALASALLCAPCLFVQSAQPASAQSSSTKSSITVLLWPNGAPGALGTGALDKPTITIYLPAQNPTHTGIVVCPGGRLYDAGNR